LAVLDLDEEGVADCALHRTPTLRVRRGRKARVEYDVAAMCRLLALATHGNGPLEVAIEAQGPRPGQGVVSMYRLGFGLGVWLGLVGGRGVPYRTVAPGAGERHPGPLRARQPEARRPG